MRHWIRSFLIAAAAATAWTPASAANLRTWVSGRGADQAGCGPIATPCRTLQYAHDNTTAGGEINVLDAAGYGSLAIGKAISVINDGAGVAGVLAPSGGNGVTITAGSDDDITLRGLTIEGMGAGTHGIAFFGGRGLSVSNCSVQNFTGDGIQLYTSPSVLLPAKVRIAGVTIEKAGSKGINQMGGPLLVQIENTSVFRAGFGIVLAPTSGTTTASILSAHVSSVVIGIEFVGTSATVVGAVDSSSVSHGGNIGYYTNGSQATMYLSRSVSRGFNAGANQVSGKIYSYGNNMFEDSGAGVTAIPMR
mgnify:CR=1 FL=1